MHFIIRQTDEKVSVEKCRFTSICELIRYHMITKDPITDQSGAILLCIFPRQNWEVSHEQIELGELLGEGAMSAIYRVKVRKGRKLDRETVKQICREARIMRRLKHSNIVRFYGIAISKEPIMLLMELSKDGNLDAFLIAKGSTLGICKKLYFCLNIASGLEFLHNNGIIHRDISAKWLAPETMRSAIYTTKSDVFSYGILLWEVFTNGAEPYCGMTMKDGYRIPPPDTMPKRLQILQQNCFATEFSERWSMTQIRKEIEMTCSELQN